MSSAPCGTWNASSGAADLAEKVRRVFTRAGATKARAADRRGARDLRRLLRRRRSSAVRRSAPHACRGAGTRAFAFRDPRCAELLFRYRARNWPDTLDAAERHRWSDWRRTRLTTPALGGLTLDAYFAEIDTQRANAQWSSAQRTLLDQLEQWGREVAATL